MREENKKGIDKDSRAVLDGPFASLGHDDVRTGAVVEVAARDERVGHRPPDANAAPRQAGHVARLHAQLAGGDQDAVVALASGVKFRPHDEPVNRTGGSRTGEDIPGHCLQRGAPPPKHVHHLAGRQHQRSLVRAGQQQHTAAGRATVHCRLDVLPGGDCYVEGARGRLQHRPAALDTRGAVPAAQLVSLRCEGGRAGQRSGVPEQEREREAKFVSQKGETSWGRGGEVRKSVGMGGLARANAPATVQRIGDADEDVDRQIAEKSVAGGRREGGARLVHSFPFRSPGIVGRGRARTRLCRDRPRRVPAWQTGSGHFIEMPPVGRG